MLGSWHLHWRGKTTKASAGPLSGVERRALGGGLGVRGLEVSGLGLNGAALGTAFLMGLGGRLRGAGCGTPSGTYEKS